MSLPLESLRNRSASRLGAALHLLRGDRKNAQLIGGSLVMLVGTGLVSAVNFGYNVAVARMLGPTAFGHAAAAVTLLMLVSAITLAFQLVCAKFIARNDTAGAKANVYRTLMRRAWYVGVPLGSLLIIASNRVAHYLRLPSGSLVVLLALGVAFYIPLGVKRGGLQGICSFRKLTLNFVLEAVARFLGAIVLIEFGLGVYGAVGAIALSVMLAYFFPLTPRELEVPVESGLPASFREGMQAIVFFVGQVVINNIDILLVKHFFESRTAGLYAAVALVGRVLYFFSWSVVSTMFPISAGTKTEDESTSVLVVPLALVLGISVLFTLGLGMFPELALGLVFGPDFRAAGHSLDSLLMLYAASTGVYALAVVLMAYELSRKLANTAWVQLAFSGAIVAGIMMFHSTLRDVVLVQLVAMVVLLIVVSLPFFRTPHPARFRRHTAVATAASIQLPLTETTSPMLVRAEPRLRMNLVRRVTESEVIAEFLRNEFHHAEFDRDRSRFERCVEAPDINNATENALRRALLFRRRGTMWRELPDDTQWWEVEMTAQDLHHTRVFPRAQWRKIAVGDFLLPNIVQRIRAGYGKNGKRTARFLNRLMAFSSELQNEDHSSAILLIGVDHAQPLTIMEGNHRLTAAMLASPEVALSRFRFFCGLSSRMTECCWYQTNLTTLWRYARNRLKILVYDKEAELSRIAHHSTTESQGPRQKIVLPAVAGGDESARRRAS
jgi:O-antigen/teichoic acid export membrane protein